MVAGAFCINAVIGIEASGKHGSIETSEPAPWLVDASCALIQLADTQLRLENVYMASARANRCTALSWYEVFGELPQTHIFYYIVLHNSKS